MQLFQLQKYAAKDYNGLVTANNLGALYMKRPQLVTNTIHQIFRTNLKNAMFDFLNQFPTVEVEENNFYEWMLQGQHDKNIPLLEAYDATGTSAAAAGELGAGVAAFYMVYGEEYFEPDNILKGNKAEYLLRVLSVKPKGTNYEYEVELLTSDPMLSVPAEELEAGSRWAKFFNVAPSTLSNRGQKPNFTSPFRMRNRITMQRFEYEVPGNMINEGKNYPLEFSFPGVDGKQERVWINYLDMIAMYQAEVANVVMHFYGLHNFTDRDLFLNKDASGKYPVESGAGLFEQIAPSNIHYYSTLDLDFLTEVFLDLSIGRIEMGNRVVTLCTGEYGIRDFHRAVLAKGGTELMIATTSGQGPGRSNDTTIYKENGGKLNGIPKPLSAGFQFTKYYSINGITFELMYCPMFDDKVLFPETHPEGGTTESRRMLALDFGGEAGIKRVAVKGQPSVFRYIPGMRDPFTPAGKGSPSLAVSRSDGYEIHRMMWGGMMITDPTKVVDFRYNLV